MKRELGYMVGTLVFVVFFGVGPTSDASAFQMAIPTKISLLKWGGNPNVGKLYKIVSKPAAAQFSLPTGTSNPISLGGSLTVTVTGGSGSTGTLSCNLQAGAWDGSRGWRALGNPEGSKGYKYTNKGAPGNDPCKIAIIKGKVIKVLAKSVGDITTPADSGNGDVSVSLIVGNDKYCAEAKAQHFKEKANSLIKMKDRPEPGECAPEARCGDDVVEGSEECEKNSDCPAGKGCVPPGQPDQCRCEQEVKTETVGPGGTVSTDDPPAGATPEDSVETAVTLPDGGTVTIVETSTTTSAPTGFFVYLGQQVEIMAPDATSAPLEMTFWLDGSHFPLGFFDDIRVLKDRDPLPDCTGGPGQADPDPCVWNRGSLGDDITVTVLTTTGSVWNFGATKCGNGVQELPDEECDDGNLFTGPGDTCDWACKNTEFAQDNIPGGGSITTDEPGDPGASDTDPVETEVKFPPLGGGTASIVESSRTAEAPTGFHLLGQQVRINAPDTTPGDASEFYEIIFRLDASLQDIFDEIELRLIAVFKDGVPVPACHEWAGDNANPDPCVVTRELLTEVGQENDVKITVRSKTASVWTFGWPGDCCLLNPQTMNFTFSGPDTTCGILRSFSCSNSTGSVCGDSNDCDFGTCIDPPGLCDGNLGVTCSGNGTPCVGTCDEQTAGGLPMELDCGAFYFGGGLNSVPLPVPLPGVTTAITAVTSCDSGTREITIDASTPGEVGQLSCTQGRTCSDDGVTHCVLDSDCSGTCDDNCLFGAPTPMPNGGTPATSVCNILTVDKDASGTAWCDGSIDLNLPLRMALHLTGDLFKPSTPPDIAGIQTCPLCVRQCTGGVNVGLPCTEDSQCPGAACPAPRECVGGPNHGVPCTDDADCPTGLCVAFEKCMGGPNDGLPCAPGSDDLGENFRTSHDCPPDPILDITEQIGGMPLDLELTTGSVTVNAVNHPGSIRAFCGFCRDALVEGTLCFDGDPSLACPVPGDLNAVPCNDDSDCTAPYESCAQRDPGAFSHPLATQITLTGFPVAPALGNRTTLVTAFCIPPTFDPTVDAATDLPGPGVVTLEGEAALSP